MKFCFLCGKETEKLIEGYCKECFEKEFQLVKVSKEIEIIKCNKCEKFQFKNKWVDELDEAIVKNVKKLGDDVKVKVHVLNGKVHVYAKGFIKGHEKQETYHVDVKIKKIICKDCSRSGGGYYEAVLQLRGNTTDDILELIEKTLEKSRNRKAFYKTKELKEGIDYYVGSKSVANKLAETLRKKGYKVKKTFKLITRKDGRNVYRTTISVRI